MSFLSLLLIVNWSVWVRPLSERCIVQTDIEGGYDMPDNGWGSELRRYGRRNLQRAVYYCLKPRSDEGLLIGSGIDISEFGMSMATSYPLKKGQSVIIKSSLPVPHRRAIVRWVKELNENCYQVGLEFIIWSFTRAHAQTLSIMAPWKQPSSPCHTSLPVSKSFLNVCIYTTTKYAIHLIEELLICFVPPTAQKRRSPPALNYSL